MSKRYEFSEKLFLYIFKKGDLSIPYWRKCPSCGVKELTP
jgi:hypothetical protein